MIVALFVALPLGYALGLLALGPMLTDALDRWRDGPTVGRGVCLVTFDAFLKDGYQ